MALPATPSAFSTTATAAANADVPARGEWWRVFRDPALDDLIARAEQRNFTIRQAEARLAQAEAQREQTSVASWPRLTGTANATRQNGTLTNAAATTGPLYVLGASAAWELDLMNRLGRERDAVALDSEERADLVAAVRLLVQAEIARLYFLLRGIDEERALLRGTVAAQQKSLQLTQGLVRSGLAAELTAVRQHSETEALAAEAVALDQRRAETEQALGLLVGEPAPQFRLAGTGAAGALPVIPPGIPGTVLARRPDVRAARQAMFAAQVRVGVARDAWLPTLTLNAFGGFAAASIPAIFAASAASSGLGALGSLPILDGGRYQANAARAIAERDLAVANYGQQILVAFKEVEEQLAALRLLGEQEAVVERAGSAARRTRVLVASNYGDGLASQLELLDAERNALREQRQAVRLRAQCFQATVALVKALGGGWGDPPRQIAMGGQ
jgi:multidrug efflux system outer membrane protein